MVFCGCKVLKIVSTERSQALVGTAKLFGKLQQEESTKAEVINILLLYRVNGSAVCLPLSIGTGRLY